MRFALLGEHPTGLSFMDALLQTGRHQLVSWFNDGRPLAVPEHWQDRPSRVNDLEELLADPDIEAVVVASHLDHRAAHIRRAIQSERHVVSLHPVDPLLDPGYEAGMLQESTGFVLFPLLTDCLHPGVARLQEMLHADSVDFIGKLHLIELDHWSTGPILLDAEATVVKGGFPGWDMLRAIGGEIMEVSLINRGEVIEPESTVLISGQFDGTGLFRMNFLPHQVKDYFRIRIIGSKAEAELLCPNGLEGAAFLNRRNADGDLEEEFWTHWSPESILVHFFERAVGLEISEPEPPAGSKSTSTDIQTTPLAPTQSASKPSTKISVSWQDALRCMELDDAARRSGSKGRTVQLEYPEASEEVNFKGTMTLVGCAMLWIIIIAAIASSVVPQLGWVVGPVLFIFLVTQLLRWVIPAKGESRE